MKANFIQFWCVESEFIETGDRLGSPWFSISHEKFEYTASVGHTECHPLSPWRQGMALGVTHRRCVFKLFMWYTKSRTTKSIPGLYKFRFYTSKLNEIRLHCHWLYFSSIIMSFGQGAFVLDVICTEGKAKTTLSVFRHFCPKLWQMICDYFNFFLHF